MLSMPRWILNRWGYAGTASIGASLFTSLFLLILFGIDGLSGGMGVICLLAFSTFFTALWAWPKTHVRTNPMMVESAVKTVAISLILAGTFVGLWLAFAGGGVAAVLFGAIAGLIGGSFVTLFTPYLIAIVLSLLFVNATDSSV